jgi:uncharacterized protein YukE
MRPTADPQHLRQMAQKCRDQADRLDNAVSTLSSQVSRNMSANWTGVASVSLVQVLDIEMRETLAAARVLRSAAGDFDKGAAQVEAYRKAEQAREAKEAQDREDAQRNKNRG